MIVLTGRVGTGTLSIIDNKRRFDRWNDLTGRKFNHEIREDDRYDDQGRGFPAGRELFDTRRVDLERVSWNPGFSMIGPFYARPESCADAIAILEQYGERARILNGGTDLMVRIQKMHIAPEVIVDIKRVYDIGDLIEWSSGSVSLGARLTMARLIRDKTIQRWYPALADAASTVGSIQIRNRATLAGNICNASPAADTIPPLLVYGATVRLVGPSGVREVSLDHFFLGPGKTVRDPAELVESIAIPIPDKKYAASFGRLTRRHGVDLATINMACGIDPDGTVIFAFGAVGPTPIVVRDTGGILADPDPPAKDRDDALQKLIDQTSPISDVRATVAYRSAMLLSIGRRVLSEAHRRREQL